MTAILSSTVAALCHGAAVRSVSKGGRHGASSSSWSGVATRSQASVRFRSSSGSEFHEESWSGDWLWMSTSRLTWLSSSGRGTYTSASRVPDGGRQ